MPPEALPTQSITMVDPSTGRSADVPFDQINAYRDQGFTIETPDQRSQRLFGEVQESLYGGTKGAVLAGTAGLLRGASLGTSDVAARILGDEDTARTLTGLREVNPGVSIGSEIAGMLLPEIVTGGAATPVGLASGLGRAVSRGAGGRVAGAVAGGLAEGALYGAGQGLSELALSPEPLTVEHIGSTLGSNVLFGAATGGVVGGAGKVAEMGLQRAGRAVRDFAERQAAAQELVNKGVAVEADLAALDRKGLDAARRAELDAIETARVPQREQLAADIAAAREQDKADKLWLSTKAAKDEAPAPSPSAPSPIPTYEHLKAQPEAIVTTVPSAAIKERGWYEMPGQGEDVVKADKARAAMREGQRDPVKITVGEDGKLFIEDGRNRLNAAVEQDAPIKVRWDYGTAGGPGDVFKGGPARTGSRIEVREAELPKPEPVPSAPKLTAEDARAVREAGKIALEADRAVDRVLRNPKALTDSPRRALAALQQQEHALEQVTRLSDRIRPTLAADTTGARAAALDKVPAALERNRALQQRISALTAEPASERLAAIENAQEVLRAGKPKTEPPPGTKLLSHVAYGATAGVVGHVPFVGHLLGPVLGSKVADAVTGAMGKLSGAATEASKRGSAAAASFLDVASKGAAKAPLATRVLMGLRYALPDGKEHKEDLPGQYKRVTDEIKRQVQIAPDGTFQMTDAARAEVARHFDGIRPHAPVLADRLETHAARKITWLASQVPRMPDAFAASIGPLKWQPPDLEMRRWARMAHAAEDPMAVLERVVSGHVTPEDVLAMVNVNPEIRNAFISEVSAKQHELRKTLPYDRKLSLSIFTGVPVDPAMHPAVLSVLQGQFTSEPGSMGGTQAPKAQPQFGSLSKSLEQPTPAQHRAQGAHP